MKKIFFIMLTLSVIAFASCSNDDNILEPQERITAEVNDSVLQIVQQNLERQSQLASATLRKIFEKRFGWGEKI